MHYKIVIVVLISIFVIFPGTLLAQQPLADLSIRSMGFDSAPKEGDIIGPLKIIVENKGSSDCGENKLKVECLAVDCKKESDCQRISKVLTGNMIAPPLKKGQSLELFWKLDSEVKWVTGNFLIDAIIDPEDKIKESNESNNSHRSAIYLRQISPLRRD